MHPRHAMRGSTLQNRAEFVGCAIPTIGGAADLTNFAQQLRLPHHCHAAVIRCGGTIYDGNSFLVQSICKLPFDVIWILRSRTLRAANHESRRTSLRPRLGRSSG